MFIQWLLSLSLATNALAITGFQTRSSTSSPGAFDGQYQTSPVPGPDNTAMEWWWFQVVGDPDPRTGIVPSFEAIFYLGFIFTRAPTDPTYRMDVSGVFPNGTTFFVSTPVSELPKIISANENVSGTWASEGGFAVFDDISQILLAFNSSMGVQGGVGFHRENTPSHVPCGSTTRGEPFFSSLAQGQTLNGPESILYDKIGWVVAIPRAKAEVNVTIHGTPLFLTGTGYHDHNWGPAPVDQFAKTWLLGLGNCGPYDLGFVEVQALNSTHDKSIVYSALAFEGEFVDTECYRHGSPPSSTVDIQLLGQTVDPLTQQNVPTGWNVTYVLGNGTAYQFTLQNQDENPDVVVYHRWRLAGSGGEVGGTQYQCTLVGEWLNPGLVEYKEGVSIFDG